jgi:hypothetical protein
MHIFITKKPLSSVHLYYEETLGIVYMHLSLTVAQILYYEQKLHLLWPKYQQ